MMTTTPTFRVADGMLVENARMEKPNHEAFEEVGDSGTVEGFNREAYHLALDAYREHSASLRSIAIAPGCVFEKQDGLELGKHFKVDVDYRQGTGSPEYAWPIEGMLGNDPSYFSNGVHRYLTDTTPPARAFSLAEALEIWDEAHDEGRLRASGDSWEDKKTYFKQRFNIEL